jgi:hypothetical protein
MDSRLLMTMQVAVVDPQKIGAVPHGTRVTAPIASGHFEGPRLRGKVLPGGGDWTLLRGDGVLELDLRVTLETDDGALIHMTSFGLRHGPPEVIAALARGESVDPSTYYFRTTPRFETGHANYAFLNRLVAVSSGDRRATGPIYTIDEIAVRSASPDDRRTSMRSRPLMTLRLSTAPVQSVGAGPHGTRLTFPIIGGSFDGERLRGKVLPGGGDWVVKRADGVLELDLRITLETEDGALVHMTFEGIRDDATPGSPYFRTLPRFETADARYSFLNRLLAVGAGAFSAGGPVHVIEEIL